MSAREANRTERRRVATGLLLAVAVVAVVALLPTAGVALIFAAVAVVAAWEWGNLLTERGAYSKAAAAAFAALLAVLWFAPSAPLSTTLFGAVLYLAVAWWFTAFVLVSAYRESWCAGAWLHRYFCVGLPLVLAGAWVALWRLHANGAGWLLYLLALVAVSDIGAYYAGRRWGKRQLAPELSPGKTVAGLWGALACVAVLAVAAASATTGSRLAVLEMVLLSLFAALAGIVGDLSVSMLKRRAGKKDSGTLLPGHGGVLDRADSTLAAAPMFVFAFGA